MTTRYFFDTEFIEDGRTIDLISIGIVAESGESLYLQSAECDFQKANDWVWRNVFPHLIHFDMRGKRICAPRHETYDSGLGHRHITRCGPECFWATRSEIRESIVEFCDPEKHGKPEIWGYYADYDWVALCQLFGTMVQLPKGWPMYCHDLKQLLDAQGNPQFQKETDAHHALSDAQWICDTYSAVRRMP